MNNNNNNGAGASSSTGTHNGAGASSSTGTHNGAGASSSTGTHAREQDAPAPILRFPEFRGTSGWEVAKFGDLLQESRIPSQLNDPSMRITVRLHLQGIERREHRGTESTESTSNFSRKSGQFIYGKQNIHKGAFGIIPRDLDGFESSQDLPCFDFKDRCCPAWFYFNLASEAKYGLLELSMTGTGSKRLNEKTFLSLTIATPTLAEQQRIADCLSSLDALIAAQARKVDALKTHKKGLMQQLFPRAGETQPRLRFPEFQGAAAWEETQLGQLGELVSGLTYSPNDVRESGLLVLRSSNVQNGKITLDDNVFVTPTIKGANLSQPKDILICVRNGSKALIGKSAMIPEGMPLCTHGAFMTVFRAKIPNFVFQLFQSDTYQKQVAGDLGATINSINGGQLLKYVFFVPSLAEQQRIADCLSSLDALIAAAAQQLETLKTHKRGLMQQLFPSLEEVES
jgi:type I restriction enzyme, S subunit